MISWPDEWRVEHSKIVNYLLNINHPEGHAKAKALLASGFSPLRPNELISALREHAATSPHREAVGKHGLYLIFEGPLHAPRRTIATFRSVWEVRGDGRTARMVTGYPFDERKAANFEIRQ